MIDEYKNPWKTKSRKTVYENNFILVSDEAVVNPSGKDSKYGKVHFKNNALGIIPIDEEGDTWLVGQYRYALDAYSWEIPEGGGAKDEDILEAAMRELREEVGLVAKKWSQIASANTSNSVTDEAAYLFIAQDLSETETEHDDTEQLQIKKVSLNEAFEMAMNGTIKDAMSLVALFKLKLMLEEKTFFIKDEERT
jgi:8-oxo-dGTP pyrophosphatase MutT (NUDIX family)